MCVSPATILIDKGPVPVRQEISCRQCWQCKENKINDFVGRALCEAASSDWSVALTLTYAPRSDLSEKIITPHHFQNFMKRMRILCPKLRYLVCGEYGEEKGRAHFHCVLFGKGERVQIPNKTITHIKEWPHGHVFADWTGSPAAMRYVAKYVCEKPAWFSMSKKPPLGDAFLKRKAQDHIELGIYPRSFDYLPPAADYGKRYTMTNRSKQIFIERLFSGWVGPVEPARMCEQLQDAYEAYLLRAWKQRLEDLPLEEKVVMFEQHVADNAPEARTYLKKQLEAYDDWCTGV